MGTARGRSIAALTIAIGAAGILARSATAAAEASQSKALAPHGRGTGSPVAPSGPAEEILRNAKDYRSWQKFAQYAQQPKVSKTHSGNYVVAWYNDAAAPATRAPQDYPDGSIIVKENRLTPDGEPASLSVMAKRAGRWVWISATPDWKVFTVDGKPLSGDIGSCAGCHGEAPKDSVYSR